MVVDFGFCCLDCYGLYSWLIPASLACLTPGLNSCYRHLLVTFISIYTSWFSFLSFIFLTVQSCFQPSFCFMIVWISVLVFLVAVEPWFCFALQVKWSLSIFLLYLPAFCVNMHLVSPPPSTLTTRA